MVGSVDLMRVARESIPRGRWAAQKGTRYQPIAVAAEQDLHIWGVVSGVVRKL